MPFFAGLSKHAIHEVLFLLEPQTHERGEALLKEGDTCDRIILVQSGWLEVFTKSEGEEFVIERLSTSSVLNYRSFFTEDIMHVNIRALTNVQLQVLTQEALSKKQKTNPVLDKQVQMHAYKLMNMSVNRSAKRWPLDYILNCDIMREKGHASADTPFNYSRGRLRRENILKNAAFRSMMQIRKSRRQPKL